MALARGVTGEHSGDGDVCSFLGRWESRGQGEAAAASGRCVTPTVALGRQLWDPTEPQCPGEGADGLLAGPGPC